MTKHRPYRRQPTEIRRVFYESETYWKAKDLLVYLDRIKETWRRPLQSPLQTVKYIVTQLQNFLESK